MKSYAIIMTMIALTLGIAVGGQATGHTLISLNKPMQVVAETERDHGYPREDIDAKTALAETWK
jgi:hypothetical protein